MEIRYFLSTIHEYRYPKIIFGLNSIEKLGSEARNFGNRALLVTDRTLVRVGLVDNICSILERSGVSVEIFHEVEPEPRIQVADKVAEVARSKKFDVVVGLGGGSSLDMAKVASAMAKNPGPVEGYLVQVGEHSDLVKVKGLPLILVPTTAGTGSEVSRFAVISVGRVKRDIVSDHIVADVAVIDPLLTTSMPPKLTAGTGLDALSHAIEGIMSTFSSPLTDAMALGAIELIARYLPRAYFNGDDIEARYYMALAATMAGLTLSGAGVVIGHSIAYTVAAESRLHHGLSCAIALPYSMIYNLPVCPEKLETVAAAMGENISGLAVKEAAKRAIMAVSSLNDEMEVPSSLRELGIPMDRLAGMVDDLLKNYPRPNNPRKLARDDLIKLYERMYEGDILL